MASAIYDNAKTLFISTGLNLSSLTIKCLLIDTDDYSFSAAHEDLADVVASSRVGTAQTLTGKTVSGGVFDATDITFSSLTGDQVEALILYYDSGASATSTLIAYIDSATGLPLTPSGSDATIQWDSGANKIFAF